MAVSLPLVSLAGQSDWARKENRNEISKLSSGDVSSATASMEAYLQARPEDPETLFGLTADLSLAGRVNTAEDYFLRSLKAGADLGRFGWAPSLSKRRAGETFVTQCRASTVDSWPDGGSGNPIRLLLGVRTERFRLKSGRGYQLKSVIARSVSL